jgi:hypothetical protein
MREQRDRWFQLGRERHERVGLRRTLDENHVGTQPHQLGAYGTRGPGAVMADAEQEDAHDTSRQAR